jgi:hemerythrin-like domain-containing protein
MTMPGNYTTEVGDMFAVHHALLGALDAAPSLVGGAGDNADRVEVIGSYYENVLEFLHVHHAGEDEVVYPLLEERCPDDAEVPKRIDDQHGLLNEPMAIAQSAIAAWRASPSVEGGEAIVSILGTVDETLRPHLGEEETIVLPIASAWLSQEEWAMLPAHALQHFSKDKPWLALGLIREQLTEDQKARMLAGMPQPVQDRWVQQWEPAFSSFIDQVRQ